MVLLPGRIAVCPSADCTPPDRDTTMTAAWARRRLPEGSPLLLQVRVEELDGDPVGPLLQLAGPAVAGAFKDLQPLRHARLLQGRVEQPGLFGGDQRVRGA